MRKNDRKATQAEAAEIIAEAGIDPADAVAVAAARVDLFERSAAQLPKAGKAAQVTQAALALALRNAKRHLADLRGEDQVA